MKKTYTILGIAAAIVAFGIIAVKIDPKYKAFDNVKESKDDLKEIKAELKALREEIKALRAEMAEKTIVITPEKVNAVKPRATQSQTSRGRTPYGNETSR